MAPISSFPSSRSCARRTLCGPANERSSLQAMPRSNSVRCSGRLTLPIKRCRSWSFAGSAWTSARERKSACFWLLPSSATLSPGSISACNASTVAPVSRTLPFIQRAIRANRAGLLHPAPRPAVRLPFGPDARTHFDVPKNTRRHRSVTILTSGCADFEADCERPGG